MDDYDNVSDPTGNLNRAGQDRQRKEFTFPPKYHRRRLNEALEKLGCKVEPEFGEPFDILEPDLDENAPPIRNKGFALASGQEWLRQYQINEAYIEEERKRERSRLRALDEDRSAPADDRSQTRPIEEAPRKPEPGDRDYQYFPREMTEAECKAALAIPSNQRWPKSPLWEIELLLNSVGRKLNGPEKDIYFLGIRYFKLDKGYFFLSAATAAAWTGYSVSTIRTAFRSLEQRKLILCTQRGHGGRQTKENRSARNSASRYTLILPDETYVEPRRTLVKKVTVPPYWVGINASKKT
jgi:hypothetical protein